MKRRAIFLDRDGTLNVDVGFTHRVEDLRLVDHVVPGLRLFGNLGFRLFITTNQSGVARGLFDLADAHTFNAALVACLAAEGIAIDGVYCCPFHPREGRGVYRLDSPLRKPAPGMIRRAAAQHRIDLAGSFAVGDRPSDVVAGRAAGCRTILVRTGQSERAADGVVPPPDCTATDLLAAALWVAGELGGRTGIGPRASSAYSAGNFDPLAAARSRA